MNGISRTVAPWHLWVIGIVSLLWNAFGALDYIRTQSRDVDYIASMTEPFGMSAEQAIAYYDAFPLWADAAWAFGVWGSLAGSLLLLFRSRFAVHAFVLSLVGLIGGTIYQIINPMEGVTSPVSLIFTFVIFAVIVALVVYARRMTAKGVLR